MSVQAGRDVYVHLGDSEHRPMETVSPRSKSDLLRYAADARHSKWPIRFQVGTQIVDLKDALRALPRAKTEEVEAACPVCGKWIEATTGKRKVFRKHDNWLGNRCNGGRGKKVSQVQVIATDYPEMLRRN